MNINILYRAYDKKNVDWFIIIKLTIKVIFLSSKDNGQ